MTTNTCLQYQAYNDAWFLNDLFFLVLLFSMNKLKLFTGQSKWLIKESSLNQNDLH